MRRTHFDRCVIFNVCYAFTYVLLFVFRLVFDFFFGWSEHFCVRHIRLSGITVCNTNITVHKYHRLNTNKFVRARKFRSNMCVKPQLMYIYIERKGVGNITNRRTKTIICIGSSSMVIITNYKIAINSW